MCLKITNNAIVVFNERKEKEMKTQEVIKRLEKELGIEFRKSKDLSLLNWENIDIRFIENDVYRYVYAEIKGIIHITYWVADLEQVTDEMIDEFISKVKLHLPKVGDIKEETINYGNETVDDILEEIKEHQKSINILLNRLNYKLKKGEIK